MLKWDDAAAIAAVTGALWTAFVAVRKLLKERRLLRERRAREEAEEEMVVNALSAELKAFRDEVVPKLDFLESQLKSNGGGSLKDDVRRLGDALELTTLRWRVWAESHKTPLFETDARGEVVSANRALCELFGLAPAEMLGRGWLIAVGRTPDERLHVWEEWVQSVENDIPYETRYHVVNQRTGALALCRAYAVGQRSRSGELLGFTGTVEPQG